MADQQKTLTCFYPESASKVFTIAKPACDTIKIYNYAEREFRFC